MLVNQQDTNVFSLLREVSECLLDCGSFCLGVDDQKVALRVWRVGDVLFTATNVMSVGIPSKFDSFAYIILSARHWGGEGGTNANAGE